MEKGIAYILGILSLVLAFFQPLPAIVIGIVGLVQNREDKSKAAKRLNILGIVIGVLVFAILIAASIFLASTQNFPIY